MSDQVHVATVELWGKHVGAVAWNDDRQLAEFEYAPEFLDQNLDVAPLTMPMMTAHEGRRRFSFPGLPRETFLGLPGLLADSLPDRFGNRIIDAWLARQGRSAAEFSPVERLCYTGRRGMGALEFRPAVKMSIEEAAPVEVRALVELAQSVLDGRRALQGDMGEGEDMLLDILRVGTSAGGGRPKAVIAFHPENGEVRSGQVDAPEGFEHWILKFDGVHDQELGDPAGYGRIEYAYYLMAQAAGIEIQPCRLLEENGRAHFMTRRFDRPTATTKLHMQSLCAIAHYDFNDPSAWSYEQAFVVMRALRLPYPQHEEMFRRTVFNVAARNQDDHTKNIAFLMDEDGQWRLSPAFDLTYAYNPSGRWTQRHQMSVGGQRDAITRDGLVRMAKEMSIKRSDEVVDQVSAAVRRFPEFAAEAGVDEEKVARIVRAHRDLAGAED